MRMEVRFSVSEEYAHVLVLMRIAGLSILRRWNHRHLPFPTSEIWKGEFNEVNSVWQDIRHERIKKAIKWSKRAVKGAELDVRCGGGRDAALGAMFAGAVSGAFGAMWMFLRNYINVNSYTFRMAHPPGAGRAMLRIRCIVELKLGYTFIAMLWMLLGIMPSFISQRKRKKTAKQTAIKGYWNEPTAN